MFNMFSNRGPTNPTMCKKLLFSVIFSNNSKTTQNKLIETTVRFFRMSAASPNIMSTGTQ